MGAIVHPAMISPDDGNNLDVPLGFFPSMDESKDVVEKIHEAMMSKPFADSCDFKLYSTVYVKSYWAVSQADKEHRHHGWAAARADLNDPENKKQWGNVYHRLADYFSKG